MNVNGKSWVIFLSSLVLVFNEPILAFKCKLPFEGFGVFLGSNIHLAISKPGTEAKVVDVVYNELGIRKFRISYEQQISPAIGQYEINCTDPYMRAWKNILVAAANHSDVTFFGSCWSPPHFMKNGSFLLPQYEKEFTYFLSNVTALLKRDLGVEIEKVSPVNEPENFVAPWDHTDMSPLQLRRLIQYFDNISMIICPELAWYSTTTLYDIITMCPIQAMHAYRLDLLKNFLSYYDLTNYPRLTWKPIWMTEVSSTLPDANTTQMVEALDLAISIRNFVGTTCVQRYYYWYAYTKGPSGESLLWGNDQGELFRPKKFYVFGMFVRASRTTSNSPVYVSDCDLITLPIRCIQFGETDRVLINEASTTKPLTFVRCSKLCCVTDSFNSICYNNTVNVPPSSVCHCTI